MKTTPEIVTGTEQQPPTAVACSDLLAAVQDLSTEIYGGKLNFREVPTDTFVSWYQWRLKEQPNTETGIPLKDFDIESAMMFFEDFVKAANTELRDGVPTTTESK